MKKILLLAIITIIGSGTICAQKPYKKHITSTLVILEKRFHILRVTL